MTEATRRTIEFEGKTIEFLARDEDMNIATEIFIRKTYGRKGWLPEPGDVWLDLGANIGIFALWAHIHGAACVCYEPEDSCFQLLSKNHAGSAHQIAIGAVDGQVTLYDSPRKTNSRATLIPVHGYKEVRTVTVRAADSFEAVYYDGVKCDIEGAELDILENPWPIQSDRLILEYHTSRLADFSRMARHFDNLRCRFEEVHIGGDLLELAAGQRNRRPMFDRLIHCRGWKS